MPAITIFHNPACGTSRNTLALIRNSGVEPQIIEYLKTPPDRARLVELLAAMATPVRDLVRQKESVYADLKLDQANDDQLLDAIVMHPVLMNRPVVVTALGARLCRPSEQVLEILPNRQQAAFAKEDGEQVIDAQGRHVGR
jgi:arsenate reductase